MGCVQDRPVVIARRFNGPPDSGHGGYSAGCAGVLVDAPAAEVTLRRPPPPETPLAFRRRDRARTRLQEMIGAIVANRRKSGRTGEDFLQTLMDARYKGGAPLSE